MTERKFSAALKNLTEERDRIWMNEPEDAKKIKTIQGAYYQYAPFLLHAESERQGMRRLSLVSSGPSPVTRNRMSRI